MKIEKFVDIIGSDFYTGVPDSQLKSLCDYLMVRYKTDSKHHIIAANEGNCVAIASGYHLATGKIPVVYMQNSGEGNIINPLASLTSSEVYSIPMILVIGWRGEPGVHDEPQHVYQGKVTLKLLEDMDIEHYVVRPETSEQDMELQMEKYREILNTGKSVAFVICKNALENDEKADYKNSYTLSRENVIRKIVEHTGKDPVISTTGKISRELFEIRKERGEEAADFLTVGSMGHASSIALGVALHKPDKKVWCIDGDGAMLMHMGAAAVIGANAPSNLVHIVLNNEAHETVGGMPTVGGKVNLTEVAKACGYGKAVCVDTMDALERVLEEAKGAQKLYFIEVKCALGSRKDLGRPTKTPLENKKSFVDNLFKGSNYETGE